MIKDRKEQNSYWKNSKYLRDKKMNQGLVSIIMPSYQTENYIIESIKSVQAQTYPNWELIIIDDCSSDKTEQVVQEHISATQEHRVRFLKNEQNSGAAVSRNYGLREAKGRYIAFLDSDDLWEPEKLQKQIAFMCDHDCAFSYTNYQEIDEESNPLGVLITGPARITQTDMCRYCWPGCLTVMYDREKIGLIQIPDIRKNNDYAMWIMAIQKSDCLLLDECLGFYRKRSGSISNHSYIKLIQWHYKLWMLMLDGRKLEALHLTLLNLVFGLWKKVRYRRNI